MDRNKWKYSLHIFKSGLMGELAESGALQPAESDRGRATVFIDAGFEDEITETDHDEDILERKAKMIELEMCSLHFREEREHWKRDHGGDV